MSVGVYGMTTLNANWVEDRLQPAGSLGVTGGLDQRKARAYESDIAYIGERYDVLNRIARIPYRDSYATPDDGFREKERTSRVDFAPPRSRKEFVWHPPEPMRFITPTTVAEVKFENRRPVPRGNGGFGSTLKRHQDNHEQSFFQSTHGEFYGEGDGRKKGTASCPSLLAHSGVSAERMAGRSQGLQVGVLCGENFTNTGDPSKDSKVQRAWLYQKDPALDNVHLGGTKPKPSGPDVGGMSVPIGEGAMVKIRQDLKDRQGRLFRTATTVTKGLGSRPGVNMFQDG
jgi:hypothetical protein